MSLGSWTARGYYTVSAVTKKQFDLSVSRTDFGSAILTDVEFLLDNAIEHQVSLWKHVNSEEWISPAWLAVTAYYWSFYLSQAMTRLTGLTAWFLNKNVECNLKALGPSSGASPGAGCFRLICGPHTTMTERIVTLKKSDSRVHDEVWRILFGVCERLVKNMKNAATNSDEDRLFTAIVRSAKNLGHDWPSAFRNAVNYVPGFAYTAVRGRQVLKSLRYLRKPETYEIGQVLERFEDRLTTVTKPEAIARSPQAVFELLLDFSFIIHALATELHSDLASRHGIDDRWHDGRRRFLKANGLRFDGGHWPI